MTLQQVLTKTSGRIRRESKPEIVLELREGHCVWPGTDDAYPLSVDDLTAHDWQYERNVWFGTSKRKDVE